MGIEAPKRYASSGIQVCIVESAAKVSKWGKPVAELEFRVLD